MTALSDINARHARLDALFQLVSRQKTTTPGDLAQEDDLAELLAHNSRYLCILVSGFAEQSFKALILEYAEHSLSKGVFDHVTEMLTRKSGLNYERIKSNIKTLDPSWWDDLSKNFVKELQAIGSVASHRNNLAHGSESNITFREIQAYFIDLNRLVIHFGSLLGSSL